MGQSCPSLITARVFSGTSSDYLSDNEQSVTTESALLGDSFQKYVSYICFFSKTKFLWKNKMLRPSRL